MKNIGRSWQNIGNAVICEVCCREWFANFFAESDIQNLGKLKHEARMRLTVWAGYARQQILYIGSRIGEEADAQSLIELQMFKISTNVQ